MGKHAQHRPLVGRRAAAAGGLAATLALAMAGPALACRLALVLALDVSASVDAAEDRLQRAGLAAALTAPDVAAAILATPDAPVALHVYEWSGRNRSVTLADWRLLDSAAALRDAAAAIAGSRRSETEFPTALGYALGHAAGVFRAGPRCLFRTLDISGDGVNNEGFGPELAYANFPLSGVTVNGLVIGADPEVEAFYRDRVIRGPGAFIERAAGYDDFAEAMRRKLLREVGARVVGALPDQAAIARR